MVFPCIVYCVDWILFSPLLPYVKLMEAHLSGRNVRPRVSAVVPAVFRRFCSLFSVLAINTRSSAYASTEMSLS